VFLTGGSGFIGKQLIEKLLRSCPAVDQINVLIRPKKNSSPEERLQKVFESPVFDRLKEENPNFRRKVVAVSGDILLPGLGISDQDHARITSNSSVFLHCAASLNFAEPLRNAIQSNVLSIRKVLALARETKNIEAFVHVSTAYSNVDKSHITESIYDPPVDVNRLIGMTELFDDHQLALITPSLIGKRPNTYTFTKAVAEKLVEQERGNVPVVIIRPSIVTASHAEPFPGWVDNFSAGSGIFIGAWTGAIRNMYGRGQTLLDLVPVDMTANVILAGARHAYNTRHTEGPPTVFNYALNGINPLTVEYCVHLINRESKKNKISKKVGRPFYTVDQRWPLRVFDTDFYMPLRAKILDSLLKMTGKKPAAVKMQEQFSKLQAVLEYFTLNSWTWDTDNVQTLLKSMSAHDQEEFNFDIRKLDWSSYFVTNYIGLGKYTLKDPLMISRLEKEAQQKSIQVSEVQQKPAGTTHQ